MSLTIHLFKLIGCTTPRLNRKVSYGLLMIMICQCRFIFANKGTTLVGDLIMGEGMYLWGQGLYGKSLYLLRNIAVSLKLS